MTDRVKDRLERRAQRALEQKFRRIFDESPDCIALIHWKTGRFVEVNRSFERLTGYAAIDVIGRTPRELDPLFETGEVGLLVESMQRDGIVRDRDLSLRTRAGAQMTCVCTVSLIELDGARHAILTARDATEERRAERALRESDTLLRLSLSAARMGTWSRNLDDDTYVWSPEAAEIHGLPVEAMPRCGDEVLALVDPEDRGKLTEAAARADAGSGLYAVTIRIRRPDHSRVWVEVRGQTLTDARGRRRRSGVITDVSERRAADLAQRASREKFARLFEALPVYAIIARLDDGRIAEVNSAFEQVTGWTRGEAIGRTTVELGLIEPEVRAALRVETERHAAVRGFEFRLRCKDGELREVILDSVRVEVASEAYVASILRDVTAQKSAERALRESEEKFAKLFQGDPNPSLLMRLSDQVILDINAAYERERGVARREVIGRTGRALKLWREPERREAFFAQLDREGAVHDVEAELHLPNGAVRTVLLDAITLELAGRKCGLVVSRDITGRKQAELEVRRLNTRLEQRVAERTRELEIANRELEAFGYSVAHDLRAPLRAIIGFSTLLGDAPDTAIGAAGRQHLSRIIEGSERMSGMIDALLTLSKLMRVELNLARVSLSELARAIGAELMAGAAQRRIELVVADGIEVEGDARLLRALLENLLGNAWKYTSNNATARVEFGALPAAGPMRSFFVRDDGAGFDPVYAGRLFGVFQRLHGVGEFPGHGVGLSTVKRIAERHGGRVWAESSPGHGATFYFELPLPAAAA